MTSQSHPHTSTHEIRNNNCYWSTLSKWYRNRKRKYIFIYPQMLILVQGEGIRYPGVDHMVQILSFSCIFWQEKFKIIDWHTPLPRSWPPPPLEILDLPLIHVCITSTVFNFARSYCWLPLPSALLSVVFTILTLGIRLQFVRRFEGVADTC